jgi:hypothetical protein
MKKTLNLQELTNKAFEICTVSDFNIYMEDGKYFLDYGDIKPIQFDTVEELSEHIEAFE